jgi:hypothetical protein
LLDLAGAELQYPLNSFTMKKAILAICCLLGSFYSLNAQNVNYTAWIYQFTSWEGGVGGACWEAGTEEYTRNGWIRDNQSTAESNVACQQCNNNGNCSSTGTWATRSRNNAAVTQVRVRIDAWEDDGGGRCSHNGGDDCRTQSSTWTTLSPLEYQNTTNNWNTGNGNHRAYARVDYRYSTTDLNSATENTSVTYSTGGNRPFWGSLGAWSDVGGDCATSGTITHNQTSSFSTTVSCQQSVTFRWRVSSEANWDYLEFYINGVRQNRISGTTSWATQTYSLPQGQTSTLEWRYDKDGSVSSGEDRGFVDNVQFTAESRSMNAGSVTANQTVCSGTAASTLNSTASAVALLPNYQWQVSTNGTTWSNISGATGLAYNPPTQTGIRYYRRRVQDLCGRTAYTNTITIGVHAALAAGSINGAQTICAGDVPAALGSAAAATGGNGFSYQWQQSTNGGASWTNIAGATTATYSPPALTQNTLYRRRAISNCGETLYTNTELISVNTLSTAPTPAAVGITCPNTDVVLSASGGTAGTGSSIQWYADAAGTIPVGAGSPMVTPTQTTTYYVRREGTCNSTSLQALTVNVRDYIYVPAGNHATSSFCDDNAGWRHFYNASDEIILSVQGDFSGISSMEAVVNNNGSFHQQTENAPITAADCSTNQDPGEERFELPRSWNINYTGTLNGNYNVRYYFPAAEKTALETAAANYISTWTDCGYTYKYPFPNGFYWFKNTGTAYTAPQFEGTFLSGAAGAVNGTNYSQISGITTFSGGSGAIVLSASSSLPVELLSFEGENQGNYNLLRWATASELNNDYFELERTANPLEGFEAIARIDGAGTTSEITNYEYLDQNPVVGTNYYRLKQVDFDGTTTYSEVIALEVEADAVNNALFPNPTRGKVFYRVNTTVEKSVELRISNALGQQISQEVYQLTTGQNQITIDLSKYPAASYWIQVFGEDGQLMRTEIVNKVD